MSQATLQFLGTIAAGLLALLGIWLTVRQAGKQTKTNVAQQLIDQLQEERSKIQDRLDRIEADNRKRDERERIRDDYIQELRQHIRLGLPPPPPAWPGELRHG